MEKVDREGRESQGSEKAPRVSQEAALPVIPLWIGGRAYLTITEDFIAVRRASDGEALRRAPHCAAREVEAALHAARTAASAQSGEAWGERCVRLADALSDYAGHIAGLIAEETGSAAADAAAEVDAAIAALRAEGDTDAARAAGVRAGQASTRGSESNPESEPESAAALPLGIACEASMRPLSTFLRYALPVWRAGRPVIARVSADAPSAFFAFAELTAHCRWPAGAFCLLYGDAGTDAALKAAGCALIYA